MKKNNLFYVVAIACAMVFAACSTKSGHDLGNSAEGDDADLKVQSSVPYTVRLFEYYGSNTPKNGLPNLHSFTHAIYKDNIILIGGRQRGLHAGNYNFGQGAANKMIYVINTNNWDTLVSNWTVYSKADSVAVPTITNNNLGLPPPNPPYPLNGQFRANNAEFFTNNDTLYIIGGILGANSANPVGPTTLPMMTAIDLQSLVNAVITPGASVSPTAILQYLDPNLAVTGGEIGVNGDTVNLIFGWNFNTFFGSYTHRVLSFTYGVSNNALNVNLNQQICATCSDNWPSTSNNGNFRRRDGSVSPMIDPKDQQPGYMYYAGVFKGGATNFDTPVWVYNNAVAEQSDFHMYGNVYTCMVMPFYSKSKNKFWATMLGGMTNTRYNTGPITKPTLLGANNTSSLTAGAGSFLSVPFTNRFTTIQVDAKHRFSQYLLPDSFPTTKVQYVMPTPTVSGITSATYQPNSVAFNGAESEIFWTLPASQTKPNGVIDYDAFMKANPNGGRVGYLFGGILSAVPNVNMFNKNSVNQLTQTMASNRLFGIWVLPVKN